MIAAAPVGVGWLGAMQLSHHSQQRKPGQHRLVFYSVNWTIIIGILEEIYSYGHACDMHRVD